MVFSSTARVSLPEFRFPSFASGSQKIGDFLGVALQVQQHEVLFASLKRTNLQKLDWEPCENAEKRKQGHISSAFSAFSAVISVKRVFPCLPLLEVLIEHRVILR